jgi:hypothetical protein
MRSLALSGCFPYNRGQGAIMKRVISLGLLLATLGVVFLSGACTSTSKKHAPDFLGNYPVQSLGVLHLNIVKRYSDTLLPRDISFIFEPSSNTVKFHHKMMGDNIWIALKKNERALLREAIERYLVAFADKTLTAEGAKKKGVFGKTDVLMTWGLFGGAHEAQPTLRFDYQFITPQRPYFILANATTQGSDGANCPAIRIAISPAQCKDVLKALDETALLQLVEELKAEYEKYDEFDSNTSTVKNIENTSEENDTPVKQEDVTFDEF